MHGLRVVISSTLASRLLGAIRDTATASLFGLGPVMDAFSFAFRIPNLARRLFGEGALSAAFLPAFTRLYEAADPSDRRPAWQLASAVFSLLAVVLTALVLLAELGLAIWHLRDGQSGLLVGLTATLLPYAVLICLAAQVSAVLHALGRFGWASFVPIVLNLCWLIGVWVAGRVAGGDQPTQAYVLAGAILLAGVLQLALQIPELYRRGFRWSWQWQPVWSEVQAIGRAILPVTIALSITQINSVLDSGIAWLFSRPAEGSAAIPWWPGREFPLRAGTVSALYFAERIYQFPLGVFGVALGTVLFPLLARHAARGELGRLRDDLTLALRLVLVIGIPASLGLMVVAEPLTRLLLQHGRFTAEDTVRTAGMISAYSLGVWAYCGIPVLFRGCYALGDRRIPLQIGMLAVLSDTVLNLTLIWVLAERGLASSTALTAMGQLALLTVSLQRRLGRFDWRQLGSTALRAVVAAALMYAVCRGVQAGQPNWREVLERLFPTRPAWGRIGGDLVSLVLPVLAGGGVYLWAAWVLGLDELWLFVRRDRDEPVGPPAAEPS
jgi:putative peptidoglycan lipid II flippase